MKKRFSSGVFTPQTGLNKCPNTLPDRGSPALPVLDLANHPKPTSRLRAAGFAGFGRSFFHAEPLLLEVW